MNSVSDKGATQKESPKRPILIALFGILAIFGSVGQVVQVLFLTLLLGTSVFSGFLGMITLLNLSLAVLFFVEGVGFLKLKKWLPNLLLTVLVIGVVIQIGTLIWGGLEAFMKTLLSSLSEI